MNTIGLASAVTVLTVSVLYANNAHSQSSTSQSSFGTNGVATGTRYQLIGTDEVSFGPGIRNDARKELVIKMSAANSVEEVETDGSASAWRGDLAFDRIDFLKPGEIPMHSVSDGVSYSARVEVESTDDFNNQSEFVSSRQLGIHYGRLGRENYSAFDLGVRDFTDKADESSRDLADDNELWSLGVTTGRRFALTGLETSDPLWTVSLRGQFSINDDDTFDEVLDKQQWYLSPGLQWNSDSFKLSADVLMPFMGEVEEESDYRVRAKIQKKF